MDYSETLDTETTYADQLAKSRSYVSLISTMDTTTTTTSKTTFSWTCTTTTSAATTTTTMASRSTSTMVRNFDSESLQFIFLASQFSFRKKFPNNL